MTRSRDERISSPKTLYANDIGVAAVQRHAKARAVRPVLATLEGIPSYGIAGSEVKIRANVRGLHSEGSGDRLAAESAGGWVKAPFRLASRTRVAAPDSALAFPGTGKGNRSVSEFTHESGAWRR